MAQIQFSLVKKIKIGRPERSLSPPPPHLPPTLIRLIRSHSLFFALPHPSIPSKWKSYEYRPLTIKLTLRNLFLNHTSKFFELFSINDDVRRLIFDVSLDF